jgi:hypothetical protein
MVRTRTLLRLRRNLAAAWLAAFLNTIAPVVAYAHGTPMPIGPADSHASHEFGGQHAQHASHAHHAAPGTANRTGEPAVPHCPYCPGFAAGAPLALFALLVVAEQFSAPPQYAAPQELPRRVSLVRIARPRAPPPIS